MWKSTGIVLLLFCSSCLNLANGFGDPMRIGDGCGNDFDCDEISNSFCGIKEDDIMECECEPGYIPSTNKTSCLKLAHHIGDGCIEVEQCQIIPGTCIENTCVVLEEDLSAIDKSLDECSQDSQCPKGVCQKGLCIPIDTTPKTLHPDHLGTPCSNDSDCRINGSVCSSKICACSENFVPSKNLTLCLAKAKALGDLCEDTEQCLPLGGSICVENTCMEKVENVLTKTLENVPTLTLGSSCQHNDECLLISNAICLENVCQCIEDYIISISSTACLEMAKVEGDYCETNKQCANVKGAYCSQNKCLKALVGKSLDQPRSSSSRPLSADLAALIIFLCTTVRLSLFL